MHGKLRGRQLPFCCCIHFLWQRFVRRTEQLYLSSFSPGKECKGVYRGQTQGGESLWQG